MSSLYYCTLAVLCCSPAALFANAFLTTPTTKNTMTPFVVVSTNSNLERRRRSEKPSSSASLTTMFVTSASNVEMMGSAQKRHPEQQRLSDAEQRALLAQAAEYKRIKTIETELALKSKKTTASAVNTFASSSTSTSFAYTGSASTTGRISLLTLARASGYADDHLDQLQEALIAGQQAREALVTRNMGLVYYCVGAILGTTSHKNKEGGYNTNYVNKRSVMLQSLTKQDLIQEGAIGLSRAVDRWNADIGGKFSTYAVYWIRAAVLRCIAERDDLVRVPEHVSAAIRKMTKAAAVLGLDLERVDVILSAAIAASSSSSSSSSQSFTTKNNANWQAAQEAKLLAEEAGLTYKQMTEAMKVQQRRKVGILSFESWMQRGKDYETDLTTAKSITESSSSTATGAPSDSSEQMKQVFSRYLRPKEMEALSWRYGLVNDHSAVASSSAAAAPSKSSYLAKAEMELFGNIDSQQQPRRPQPQPQQQQQQLVVRGKTGESMSFDEVGKRMQVSAEYCRRLCRRGLEKLQRAAEDGSLELGLLF